jgi:hypothetical protein
MVNSLTKHSKTGTVCLRKGRILTYPSACHWQAPNTLGQVAHRVNDYTRFFVAGVAVRLSAHPHALLHLRHYRDAGKWKLALVYM